MSDKLPGVTPDHEREAAHLRIENRKLRERIRSLIEVGQDLVLATLAFSSTELDARRSTLKEELRRATDSRSATIAELDTIAHYARRAAHKLRSMYARRECCERAELDDLIEVTLGNTVNLVRRRDGTLFRAGYRNGWWAHSAGKPLAPQPPRARSAYWERTTGTLTRRTLAEARALLDEAGVPNDEIGLAARGYEHEDDQGCTSEDLLGCRLDQHLDWLRYASNEELLSWAREWTAGYTKARGRLVWLCADCCAARRFRGCPRRTVYTGATAHDCVDCGATGTQADGVHLVRIEEAAP